jgi:hypothetical protein
MTIPASQLVDITPRVIGGGLTGLSFVGTLLSKSERLPVGTAVPFYTLASVGEYFGTDSNEYKLAGTYFAADSNKDRTPDVIWFFRKVDAATAAFVRGASNPCKLSDLTSITNGSFTVTIDGTQAVLSALSFSGKTSFSGVAGVINDAIQAIEGLDEATCEWDTDFNAFVITSGTTGAASSVSKVEENFVGTPVGALLGLTSGVVSKGGVSTSLTDTMAQCIESNSNFFSFMPVWQESLSDAIELSTWCDEQGVRFMYVAVDNSADGLTPNNPACLAKQVAAKKGTAPFYNTKEGGAFIMGACAAINVNKLNGRKTLAAKRGSVEPTNGNPNHSIILLNNGYNFYGDYANASNQFKLFQNGQISGDAKWIDTYFGQVYLRDGLQNAWINALMNANTIPYNADGYGVLHAAAMDVINTALNAGFIRQGVSLDESQKAQVQQEAGLDISTALQTKGWYLQILDPTAQVRAERGTPIVNFWYMDGGSVQKIQGTSTVLL